MNELKNYLQDGANYQAQCVLICMRCNTIESSWDGHKYTAEICVSRWENCREQGYVAMLKAGHDCKQLNIAWFEHRNSDQICAIKWEQFTINAPTIDNADFGGKVYKDKFDVSHKVGCEQFSEMANWIWEQFESFWRIHNKSKLALPV